MFAEKEPAAARQPLEQPAHRAAEVGPRVGGRNGILRLQRTIGNRAVQRLLNVHKPNDPFEREADRVAAAVRGANAPAPQSESPGGEPPRPDAQFEGRLRDSSAEGNPMPQFNRSQIEPVVGADLSGVRIHAGPEAAALSQSIDAQAFTFGNHIYFDSGKYDPGTSSGQELLAHESAHVIQQGSGSGGVQRRLNIPGPDALPSVDIDSIVKQKSARTFEWHSQEERELATRRFFDRTGEHLLQWLQVNVTDQAELVRSFAWVIDGLDSFPHVDIALATIADSVRVPPPVVLGEIPHKGRAAVRRHYERTYALLSPRHSMDDDLLRYYGNPYKAGYKKCIALLDHDLTEAEQLYFMGVGNKSGGDIDAPAVIAFIRDRWEKNGYEALLRLDRDWANFVHMNHYWGWSFGPWSNVFFYQAVMDSIGAEKHRRVIRPILNAYESIKQDRKYHPTPGLDDDLDDELLSAYQAMTAAGHEGDETQVREAVLLYHHIWRRYLSKKGIADDPELRKRLEDRYRAEAKDLPTGKVQSLSPLKTAILTPEDRLLELHGISTGEFERLVTSAWLNDKAYFRLLVASAGPGAALENRLGDSVPARQAAALLAPAMSDEHRGYRRLLVEFNPSRPSRDIGRARPDGDLQAVYKFLTTPGMTAKLRKGILTEFAWQSLDDRSGKDPAGILLRQLYGRFEGTDGRWFLQLWDLLDPDITTEQRVERQTLKKEAGRSVVAGQFRQVSDWVRGEARDYGAGVDAGIKNQAAVAREGFRSPLAEEYGADPGADLDALLSSLTNARTGEMHQREDEAALTIASAVGLLAEGLLTSFLPPGVPALIGLLLEQATREILLGSANTAVSAANIQAIALAALTTRLRGVNTLHFAPAPLRAQAGPLLKILRKFDRPGLDVSGRAAEAMRHVGSGLHDEAIGLMLTALTDAAEHNPVSAEEFKLLAGQALARAAGRPFGMAAPVVSDVAAAAVADGGLTVKGAVHVASASIARAAVLQATSSIGAALAKRPVPKARPEAEVPAAHPEDRAAADRMKQFLERMRDDPERERTALAHAVSANPTLRLQYLKEIHGPGSKAGSRMATEDWALARIAAGDRLTIEVATMSRAHLGVVGARAGSPLKEMPKWARWNQFNTLHSETRVGNSGVVIHLAGDIHLKREAVFGAAAPGMAIVVAHGREGYSKFFRKVEGEEHLTSRQVAELVREALPEGGTVCLFVCFSQEARRSLQRELGEEKYTVAASDASGAPGYVAVPGQRADLVPPGADPEIGFASPIPGKTGPSAESRPASSGVVMPPLHPQGQAYLAGLREGDVIYEANHRRIDSLDEFLSTNGQSSTHLQVSRQGTILHFDYHWGVHLTDLSSRLSEAGAREGDIVKTAYGTQRPGYGWDSERMSEAKDLDRALALGRPVKLMVIRDGIPIFLWVGAAAGNPMEEIPKWARWNEYNTRHSETRVGKSGVVIQVARDIHLERDAIFGASAPGTATVVAHGKEKSSTFAMKPGGEFLTARQVAALIREALPEGGTVYLFMCFSQEARRSLQRELGEEKYKVAAADAPGAPGYVSPPGRRPDLVPEGADPQIGFASPIPGKTGPSAADLPASSGVVLPALHPKSIVYKAGLREGDVIYEADHQRVDSLDEVLRTHGQRSTHLQVMRQGGLLHFNLHWGVRIDDPAGRLLDAGLREGDIVDRANTGRRLDGTGGEELIRDPGRLDQVLGLGHPVDLTVIREGRIVTLEVGESGPPSSGFTVRALDPAGSAYISGLREGDVIHKAGPSQVRTVKDLETELASDFCRRYRSVNLQVTRGGKVVHLQYDWDKSASGGMEPILGSSPAAGADAVPGAQRPVTE